jgi:hypothetical protein
MSYIFNQSRYFGLVLEYSCSLCASELECATLFLKTREPEKKPVKAGTGHGWFEILRLSGLLPLRRPKRSIFLGQGPVQGPREEVQGPCARAMCKGHKSGK